VKQFTIRLDMTLEDDKRLIDFLSDRRSIEIVSGVHINKIQWLKHVAFAKFKELPETCKERPEQPTRQAENSDYPPPGLYQPPALRAPRFDTGPDA